MDCLQEAVMNPMARTGGVTAGDKIKNLTRQCFQEITDQDRNDLLDLYKYDFSMFGYSPDDYMK